MSQRVKFQLYTPAIGGQAGAIVADSGGFLYVAKAADAQKETLTKKDGSSQTNGFALTAGGAEFYVADSVSTVDLYIMAPNGQFLVKKGVKPGNHDFAIDLSVRDQVAVIPFSIADTTAATETDTGFDLPAKSVVGSWAAVDVLTIDAAITIEAGTKSSETGGDPDGFIDAVSVATAGVIRCAVSGTPTLGALLVQNFGTTPAVNVPQTYSSDANTAKSISYTLLTAADTAEGFLLLPYKLGGAT